MDNFGERERERVCGTERDHAASPEDLKKMFLNAARSTSENFTFHHHPTKPAKSKSGITVLPAVYNPGKVE